MNELILKIEIEITDLTNNPQDGEAYDECLRLIEQLRTQIKELYQPESHCDSTTGCSAWAIGNA